MKFKSLITCCSAVVCFCSNATPFVHSQKAQTGECNQVVLLPNEEQLLSLSRNEVSQSNISLNYDRKDVIEARGLFFASIRNMLIFRQFRNHIHNELTVLGVNIEKCRQELQILKNKEKELEKNIEIAKKKEEELEKRIKIAKKEATARYLRLKMAQRKAKL